MNLVMPVAKIGALGKVATGLPTTHSLFSNPTRESIVTMRPERPGGADTSGDTGLASYIDYFFADRSVRTRIIRPA